MGWVTLALRKASLKQEHSYYQLRLLQISREKRQMARRKSYETQSLLNEQKQGERALKSSIYEVAKNAKQTDLTALQDAWDNYRATNGGSGTEYKDLLKKQAQDPENFTTDDQKQLDNYKNNIINFSATSYSEWEQSASNTTGKTKAQIQADFEDESLRYQEEKNDLKTDYETELAMLEEEAADEELILDQEQIEIETQMEAISQELQAVSEAVSSQIQSSTIKLA